MSSQTTKLDKLLALASNPAATEGERAAALAAAARLRRAGSPASREATAAARYAARARWLAAQTAYPHRARPVPAWAARPEAVPGDHVSAALARGWRTYAFRTAEEAVAHDEKYAEFNGGGGEHVRVESGDDGEDDRAP